MGILNVTPDSFSDGGVHRDPGAAVAAGLRLHAQGAQIIDVGGETTRPGSHPLDPAEERARVLPVIGALCRAGLRVSADTRNAETMARAVGAGAAIINDVSALAHDARAAATVARLGCDVVLMHMRGTPATMGGLAHYQDVAAEVREELAQRLRAALEAGIAPARIALDPGFGFAKDAPQNAELLRRLPELASLGRPLVVGLSRKRTVQHLAGPYRAAAAGARGVMAGSVAAALFAQARGAAVLRVHDVAETAQAVAVWRGLAGAAGPPLASGQDHPRDDQPHEQGGDPAQRQQPAADGEGA